MDREEIVERYFAAWNQKNVSELLKLMHPQASCFDAFWGETCSGHDLNKYFSADFEVDTRWYRPDDELIAIPNGLIVRYVAFDGNDHQGLAPLFNGAEVLTISDGLILTISDFYCDPDPVDLTEIAKRAETQHSRSNIGPLGLSARTSGRIKRRLAELADKTTVYLDPSLTVTRLADRLGCSVMHLFHVLEEEKGTTFLQFVSECRVRYATTLLADASDSTIDIRRIAEQSGFESVEEFNDAFLSIFGTSAGEYSQQFKQ